MSAFRKFELIDDISPSFFLKKTSIFSLTPFVEHLAFEGHDDLLCTSLDLIAPNPLQIFDSAADLIQIDPFSSYQKLVDRRLAAAESTHLRRLSDRVSALERRFDRLQKDRKYTWTAEIKDGVDRKYKLTEEIKGKTKKYKWATEIGGGKNQKTQRRVVEVEEEDGLLKNYKWTAQMKGINGDKSPVERSYTFKAASVGSGKEKKDKKEKKEENEDKKEKKECKKKEPGATRLVEIEDLPDHGAVVLRQAFARRAGADVKGKGKKKELSPQDAALTIQVTFRAYLIRRSQALRALRELAVAKAKLKEIRALFHNFSYRNRISRDQEERQRFSEKIIVLLLTVDAVEGADVMVRSSKRSMVDELEAMLDVVDPQPAGKSLSMKRRTFDMPSGVIQKEIAAGVSKLVQMVDQDENASDAFEACL